MVALVAVAMPARADDIIVDAGMLAARSRITERDGVGFAVEIKNLLRDDIAIGGRVELAVMYGGIVGSDNADLDVSMAVGGLVKAEYRPVVFGDAPIRPWVGFGIGGYTTGSQSVGAGPNRDAIVSSTARCLGFAPQVGIDLGRFRLAATYNHIIGAYLEVHETIGGVAETQKLSQSWFSLELAFRFAGPSRK
jgi:hypothetical protein